MERLHKFLAHAGAGSRRQAEEMIREGRVTVNGETVREMGTKIDPLTDVVALDGERIAGREGKAYLLLNKPPRVVTTLRDPGHRMKVSDLLKGIRARVYPVGRLDYMTEGLLLLTNDGELAYRLTHPRFKVDKTYLAQVEGMVEEASLQKLRRGIILEDGPTGPARVRLAERGNGYTRLEITIHEGRNRQVRRMCQAIGHPVQALKRIRFGPLQLGDLQPGSYRHLTPKEISALKKACRLS